MSQNVSGGLEPRGLRSNLYYKITFHVTIRNEYGMIASYLRSQSLIFLLKIVFWKTKNLPFTEIEKVILIYFRVKNLDDCPISHSIKVNATDSFLCEW